MVRRPGDQSLTPEQWLDQMPLAGIKARIAELEGLIQKAEAELRIWRFNLGLREPVDPDEAERRLLARRNSTKPANETPTMRRSIYRVMKDGNGSSYSASALRAELVQRGWLPPTVNGANRLYGMLSIMVKSGQLQRLSTGLYALSPEVAQQGLG